ncbi:hypothetical protein Dimus_009355 [Dionaea muscipula]
MASRGMESPCGRLRSGDDGSEALSERWKRALGDGEDLRPATTGTSAGKRASTEATIASASDKPEHGDGELPRPGGVPEIFEGGVYGVIRRAIIIGNGFPGAENQCIGLVRALGLSDSQLFYRVTRPRGGLNEWVHWLPVSVHKRLHYIVGLILGYSQILLTSGGRKVGSLPSAYGTNLGLSSVLEADAKQIANMARKTFENEGPLLVVASGRDTISTASTIRRLASDYVFVVQRTAVNMEPVGAHLNWKEISFHQGSLESIIITDDDQPQSGASIHQRRRTPQLRASSLPARAETATIIIIGEGHIIISEEQNRRTEEAKSKGQKGSDVFNPECYGDSNVTTRALYEINSNLYKIQHPRKRLDRFDMVITPHHDYYPLTSHAQEQVPRFLRPCITPREPPGRNVVLTVGALHQIDAASLRSAASFCQDLFSLLPKPLLVVSIVKVIDFLFTFLYVACLLEHCQYGADLAKQLSSYLQNALLSCGTVYSVIVKEFAGNPNVYIWNGEEPNPHMGHLAWADAFVVTADSVSMLSEACSTGKPVYVIGAERCTWKFLDFHNTLKERGLVRPFTASADVTQSWSYPPLNDTAEAAARIHHALAERGWVLQR